MMMDTTTIVWITIGVLVLFGVFLLYLPSILVWLVGWLFGGAEKIVRENWPGTNLHATQVRTWEHPTEGVQVEVSQVDVRTNRRLM